MYSPGLSNAGACHCHQRWRWGLLAFVIACDVAAMAGVRGCWLVPAFVVLDFGHSRVLISTSVSHFRRLAVRVFVSAGDRDKRGGLLTSLGPNTWVCCSQRLAAWALISASDVAGGGLSIWWSASDMGRGGGLLTSFVS